MSIQVITIGTEDFQNVITDAYKEGYIKAQREWGAEKAAQKEEQKFSELIRGVKELRQYLMFKNYWRGSISTLSKVAPQLVAPDDKISYGLIFRRTCIDHSFVNGFRFQNPPKKKNQIKNE